MVRKQSGKSKTAPTPPVVHPHAAGIDIGATEIFVAVPTDRDQSPAHRFQTFTQDLHALADWLQQCRIQTVAMESAGVYWIPLFQILEERCQCSYIVRIGQSERVLFLNSGTASLC
ncbi:MAG: hypothetical protein JO249_06655 [Acidobacteria bacterium]|nr:hypothetical protein [Acidobacteriota bacterium]